MPATSEEIRAARAVGRIDPERVLPSLWARRHRRIPNLRTRRVGPFDFRDFPFLRDIMDDFHPRLVVMKAAQLGVTECLLTRALHWIAKWRMDVLYLLPSADECGDFSRARFDAALEVSPDLADLFSHVDNVHHKRAGTVNLYLRGTHSRSKLKSIPVAVITMDEFDEMNHVNLGLAFERTSAQYRTWITKVSTPTWPGFGIHAEFKATDRRRWHVPCPDCGEEQAMTWKGNVTWRGDDPAEAVATATYRCAKCGAPWSEADRRAAVRAGRWVAERPGVTSHRGYHVSQLCSPTQTADRLVAEYWRCHGTPELWRVFVNEKLGEPLADVGGKVLTENVRACRSGFMLADGAECAGPVTMGVDQGAVQDGSAETVHYWTVSEWLPNPLDPTGWGRILRAAGTVETWDELDEVFGRYDPDCCVIDANPDARRALAFARRHRGRVWLAYYKRGGLRGGEVALWGRKKKKRTGRCVDLDRTSALDRTLARIRSGSPERIAIPADHPPELERHLTAPVRVTEKDANGNLRSFYKTPHGRQDHFCHAMAYDEVAVERIGRKPKVTIL